MITYTVDASSKTDPRVGKATVMIPETEDDIEQLEKMEREGQADPFYVSFADMRRRRKEQSK